MFTRNDSNEYLEKYGEIRTYVRKMRNRCEVLSNKAINALRICLAHLSIDVVAIVGVGMTDHGSIPGFLHVETDATSHGPREGLLGKNHMGPTRSLRPTLVTLPTNQVKAVESQEIPWSVRTQ